MAADAGITKNVSFHTSRHTTQVYADVIMETKVEAISRISNYFSNLYNTGGKVWNLFHPYFHHHIILYAALRGLFFTITTFWAYSIRIEGDTAKRTAVDVILCGKLGRSGIHTACESDFSDVQFVFQQP